MKGHDSHMSTRKIISSKLQNNKLKRAYDISRFFVIQLVIFMRLRKNITRRKVTSLYISCIHGNTADLFVLKLDRFVRAPNITN